MAKKENNVKAVKSTRNGCANQVVAALTGKSTLGELATKADELFVAGGGSSRMNAATHCVRRSLETAASLGVLKLTKPTDVLVEKVKV